ncbi:hypothetical protein LWI29_014842 [Acer saccharum]|uniref:Transcription elongation factor TFIIS n=2 Tax=Acer TaxID=4022 RepID=A0AA39S6W1_ACESA|nr:hypothetical protein LWI29_014842 [Acer saccharum]
MASMFKILKPGLRVQPADIQSAALWGIAAGTTALWVVQPFDWIKKTFFEKPEPENVRRRKKEEMERKVMEYCEAAKRAAEAVEEEVEERRCIDALNHLKNVSITPHLLVSTQVARHLRPLTKHPRKRIKDFASDLIVSWKRMFIEQTRRDERNGICNNSVEVVEPPNRETTTNIKKAQMTSLEIKVRKTDQIRSPGSKKAMRLENVVAEEKISSAENVIVETTTVVAAPKLNSMIKCNDGLRDAIREKLYEALSKVASEADDEEIRHEVNAIDPICVAVSVESVMFENWGKSNGTQKTKYRSVLFNLKDPKNPDFRRKVLLGHVKPEMLVNMSAEEMASDERQRQNQQIKEKALFDCELGSAPKATTDQFKCSRCGQRKTTYYQMQTRSADEPMTTYVTCVNCNNHWKFC